MNFLSELPDISRLAAALTPNIAAVAQRDQLLLLAERITVVLDAEQQALAVDLAKRLAQLARDTEAARKEITAPLRRLKERIDNIAESFESPATGGYLRLMDLVADYQETEYKRVEAEAAARKHTIAKLEEEEKALGQAAANGDPVLEAYAASHKALTRAILEPEPRVEKPSGLVAREVWKCEVTDLEALRAARPDLVKLVADMGAIQRIIPTPVPVPGLRQWKETTCCVRTA